MKGVNVLLILLLPLLLVVVLLLLAHRLVVNVWPPQEAKGEAKWVDEAWLACKRTQLRPKSCSRRL